MSVTFVCASMQPGGAERVLAVMANHWAQRGIRVSIVTFESETSRPFYPLHPDIHYKPLGLLKQSGTLTGAVRNNVQRITVLRRAIRDTAPDAVVSFLSETNVLTLVSLWGLGIPVYVTEHTDPERWPINAFWERLRRLVYRRAARIVVLNQYLYKFFARHGRVAIVPNPVESRVVEESAAPPVRCNCIVAMGRLVREKGFDTLIEAFAALQGAGREWRLEIIGEGEERSALEKLAEDLGVAERVTLVGLVPEPEKYLRRAGIFVLSSRIEGFPMSLCEAMACGTPVISTQYHEGVFELVEPGENGLLVPVQDPSALGAAMKELIDDAPLRQRLGREAARITEKYGVERVMKQWEELLAESNG